MLNRIAASSRGATGIGAQLRSANARRPDSAIPDAIDAVFEDNSVSEIFDGQNQS